MPPNCVQRRSSASVSKRFSVYVSQRMQCAEGRVTKGHFRPWHLTPAIVSEIRAKRQSHTWGFGTLPCGVRLEATVKRVWDIICVSSIIQILNLVTYWVSYCEVFKGVMNWLFKLCYIVVWGQLMTFTWFLHS